MVDECVIRWLSGLAESTQKRWFPLLTDFLDSCGLSAREAVEFQRGNPYDYRFVDCAYKWIESVGELSVGSKKLRLSVVRSFFLANRVALPYDRHRFHSNRAPVVCGFESVEDLRKLLLSCNVTYRAAFMTAFQSGSGIGELLYISRIHNQFIRDEVRKGSRIIRVDMPGRKHSFARLPYYTFIGSDAVACLKVMFESQGYREKSALFVNQYDKPLSVGSLQWYFTFHAVKTNLIKPVTMSCSKCGDATRRVRSHKVRADRRVAYICKSCGHTELSQFSPKEKGGIRYRVKMHELRDLFKTECHRSLQSGNNFDLSCSEFWMGHSVDRLGYDKLMNDWKYGLNEYRKVHKFLNILSENPRVIDVCELDGLRREMAVMKRKVETFDKLAWLLKDPARMEKFREFWNEKSED